MVSLLVVDHTMGTPLPVSFFVFSLIFTFNFFPVKVNAGFMQPKRNPPMDFASASQWSNFGAARQYAAIPTAELEGVIREKSEEEEAAAAAEEAENKPLASAFFQLLQLNPQEEERQAQRPATETPWFASDLDVLLLNRAAANETEEEGA
ncbi:hypothetical protein Efla_000077 [Eimeria flavescens]